MQFTLPFYRLGGTPVSAFSTNPISSPNGFIDGEPWLRTVPDYELRDHCRAHDVHDSRCCLRDILNEEDGMKTPCAVNLHNAVTVSQHRLQQRIEH